MAVLARAREPARDTTNLHQDRCPEPLANRSLVKYRLIIDEFGGWPLFQQLLAALEEIAVRHGFSLANVALRLVLDRPQVAAAIVGIRGAEHLAENLRTFRLRLGDEDRSRIEAVLERSRGPTGEVFGLERVPQGPHRVIMKTDLNRLAT